MCLSHSLIEVISQHILLLLCDNQVKVVVTIYHPSLGSHLYYPQVIYPSPILIPHFPNYITQTTPRCRRSTVEAITRFTPLMLCTVNLGKANRFRRLYATFHLNAQRK